VKKDFYRVRKDRAANVLWIVAEMLRNPGFRAVLYFRLTNWLLRKRVPILPTLLQAHALRSTGADLSCGARIGGGLLLPHPVGVVVGGGAVIGENRTILQGVTVGERLGIDRKHEYPKIGSCVTLCAGAVCLGAINIGDGSVVGANAVVLTDVPACSVVAGVPARVVGRATDKQESRLLASEQ